MKDFLESLVLGTVLGLIFGTGCTLLFWELRWRYLQRNLDHMEIDGLDRRRYVLKNGKHVRFTWGQP